MAARSAPNERWCAHLDGPGSGDCARRTATVVGGGLVERPVVGACLVEVLEAAARALSAGGAGGFGKTMLAAWACERVGHWFPDGVLWVDLGQRPDQSRLVDPLTDLVRLVTGVGQEYDTVSAAADTLAVALADRRVLLGVDDAWREQDVEPVSAVGDRCVRLVTTRRPPVARGHEIAVDAMTVDEAMSVLRGALPGATAGDVRPLLRRCGRWPLALSMVAGTPASLFTRMPLAEASGWC